MVLLQIVDNNDDGYDILQSKRSFDNSIHQSLIRKYLAVLMMHKVRLYKYYSYPKSNSLLIIDKPYVTVIKHSDINFTQCQIVFLNTL